MKTVLITGPEFYNYLDNIVMMFEAAGWRVHKVSYEIEAVRNPIKKVINAIKTRALQQKVLQAINGQKFDLCVHVRGYEKLSEATYNAIYNKQIPMVLFLQDSIKKTGPAGHLLQLFSRILTFEQSDIEYLQQRGVGEKVRHFGVAYHPLFYRRLALEPKYDICFVGNIHKNERFQLMNKICSSFPGHKILIVSPFLNWKSPLSIVKFLRYPYKKFLMSGSFRPEVVNRIYNESKIVLNLQDPQNVVSYNPRTVEVWASGAFQLSKRTKDLSELMEKNVVALFESDEELLEQCRYYLQHKEEREQIARNGMTYASSFSFDDKISSFII